MCMKKLLLYLLVVSMVSWQDSNQKTTIKLDKKNFTSYFDTQKRYPSHVEWWLTKSMLNCSIPLKRTDKFKPDPSLKEFTDLEKDYLKSGFDRGHMMPAADNLCESQTELDECFYFSNISPQYHSLNAGDWKSLETYTRETAKNSDSVHVWCGNLGEIQKIGRVSVPKYCWKVIYIKKKREWKAFIFKNDKTKPDGFENNETTISEIEKMTNLKFLEK